MTERKIGVRAEDIESDPGFQHFREKHYLSDATMIGYVNAFQRYVDYTGLCLSDLIAEAEKEEYDRIPIERRKVGERLHGFRKYLKENSLSPATVKRALAAVKSFYINGYSITLPTLGRDRSLSGKIRIENKGIPDKEDIIKVFNIADLRERSIILGITSSGLSTTDFVSLTIKDFKEGYDEKTGVTVLDMRRKKTSQDFVTFFSAEATAAINEYLAWRERPKPKTAHKDILKSWEKHRIYSDSDYLLCKKYVPDEYQEAHDEELRRESEKGLQTVFRVLANRAGIARDKGVWNMFRAHKLRSWFFSVLINNGCPEEHAEVFMGHASRIGSSNGTYYSVIIPKLKETYLQFMPYLSLLTPIEVKVIETEGYKELKEENDVLRRDLEAMKAIEAEKEPVDEILSRLISDPEVQRLLRKKLEGLTDG
jgi:integrase